jgi:hypothetical protein
MADEVLHIPISFPGRDGLDEDEVPVSRVLLLPFANLERIKPGLDFAALGIEPPASLRGVVLQRFRQRPEVQAPQIEHLSPSSARWR